MKQCWISSVGSPLGFSESDMFCPSLVSPGAVCRLNNKYELNRLTYWKQNRTTRVSFTMKCSIPCLSTLTCCSSHPRCSPYCMIRPLPSSSLQDKWSHRPERSCCWSLRCSPIHTWLRWQGFSREVHLTHLLLRRLSASCWEVHRGKVTCQRRCYQTVVVILYKQPAPKPRDHSLPVPWDHLVRNRFQFLPLHEKGLLLKSTCG